MMQFGDELSKVVEEMRAKGIKPLRVSSELEAATMSGKDPNGHKWSVGDGYYNVESVGGEFEAYQVPVATSYYGGGI